MGSAAYKLKLPDSSAIHPVFHVSQLKKVAGKGIQVTPVVPSLDGLHVPVAVLQRRLVTRGIKSVQQV